MTYARRALHGLTIAIFAVFGVGATVGDIGSCGQSSDELDPVTFFGIKQQTDCDKCNECGISGARCVEACKGAPATAFAVGCRPLVHDGEVCLRALIAASCDAYAPYMAEVSPTAPSECQFCPVPR